VGVYLKGVGRSFRDLVEFIATLPARLFGKPPLGAIGYGQAARRGEGLSAFVVFLLVALLLRGATIGFPVIHFDEQFYLLVGDRMWQGALPFVDIWDRKPLGLFLLYAGIRLLGGEGIVQYQIVAMASVVATSLVIYRMARMVAGHRGALCAGAVYQACLAGFLCIGGQAPVFYNLLMALAGWGMLRIWVAADARHLLRDGLAVMALVGLALQIKYTVVFEGVGFGLALIWIGHRAGWHGSGGKRGRLFLAALAWSLTALVPTLAAWGYYAAIGHGAAFFQANFLSIFGRHEEMGGALFRLAKEMAALTPVWLAIFWAPRVMPALPVRQAAARGFLRYWAFVAVLGFLLFGTWYDHYVAPMLVPLLALAAPALFAGRAAGGVGRWLTWLLICASFAFAAGVSVANLRLHGTTAQVDEAATMIDAALDTGGEKGCLYINEGDPILYLKTHACFATRYVFPNHLNGMVDAGALEVSPTQEVERIMASHPQAVVMTVKPSAMPVNWQTRHLLFQRLGRDYRLVGMARVGWRDLLVYQRKG
jgi:4-amino-4-deoxy-L-arabinose transferase-like glycosyltransferase